MTNVAATPNAAGPPFDTLPLTAAQRDNLDRLGYHTMTPIQAASLPLALAGDDLIAQAPTGSGKTAAFALVLLARIDPARRPADGDARFAVQAMVLCPTRELADQVTTEVRRLARAEDNTKVLTLCGGAPLGPQRASLAQGAHVVVGTPGRIVDLLERGSLDLGALAVLVFDEADRMLEMGFQESIATIAKRCPRSRQTLLFSATYPPAIESLAQQFLRTPKHVRLADPVRAAQIDERFYEVAERERLHAVSLLLAHFRPVGTIAFCNTRQQCRDLADVLRAQGFVALALHGELEQRERDQVLVQFANRSASVLVATDVAARGLDIDGLAAVINVDLPPEPQTYTHRIGRTGRVDAQGLALSLASLDEMGSVGRIEAERGRESAWHPLAELAPAPGGRLVPPMATLQIVGGRKERIRAGDVLGALTGDAGFAGSQVGKISVNEYSTYVAVDRQIAAEAVKRLGAGTVKGKRVKVRLLPDA
jgi:ATP-dependent RNA helicase DbpA